MMKDLNDTIIKNKELVTALTNLYKEIFLNELQKQMPGLQYDLYSDFKALGFALPLPVSTETIAGLDKVFQAANVRFKKSKVITQIARPSDVAAQWFKAGMGASDVKAAWAARYARETTAGDRHLFNFTEAEVLAHLQKQFERFRALHGNLNQLPAALLEPADKSLKIEVFAAARKAETAVEFAQNLAVNFGGLTVAPEVSAWIYEYTVLANAFSPNLLIEKREAPSLAKIPFGAISLDFINLGAANIKASAKALSQSATVDEAALQTRITEQEVTDWLNELKAKVKTEVFTFFNGKAHLTLTGDDGSIELQDAEVLPREQMNLLNALAKLESKNFLRMAAISEQPESENPSTLLNHGEKIEKILRRRILAKLGPEFSERIDINVLIYGEGLSRSVQLILNPRQPPSATDIEFLKVAFENSLQTLEAELARKGSKITYDPLDIYAMRKVIGDEKRYLAPVVVPGYGFAPAR